MKTLYGSNGTILVDPDRWAREVPAAEVKGALTNAVLSARWRLQDARRKHKRNPTAETAKHRQEMRDVVWALLEVWGEARRQVRGGR